MSLWLPSYTLILREIRHFYRDRSRVLGVVIQPLLFWVLIGTGMKGSFNPANAANGTSYMEYFFPGILLMVIMFTAIFSTFSIIEDRKEGFLQGVLVSPAPRTSIVLGKVLGGALLGTVQGALFLLILLTGFVSLRLGFMDTLREFWWMMIVGAQLTTIGFIMAWAMTSTQGYHALMSVFLLPMWVFSGAAFPMHGAPFWLKTLMEINPLTHGLELMRAAFEQGLLNTHSTLEHPTFSVVYVLVVTVVSLGIAVRQVRRS